MAGLLIRFFEMYKDLVTIILRKGRKNRWWLYGVLLLVHSSIKFQGAVLTQLILRPYFLVIYVKLI